MTVSCQWGRSAVLDAKEGSIKGEVLANSEGGPPFQLTVIDRRLVLVAKDGGEKLSLVGRNVANGAMFFVETTPVGNVVLWSFYYLAGGKLLFMKQNNYTMAGAASDQVSAWNHAGYCTATGGNGKALTR
jgi:hypothetical protein